MGGSEKARLLYHQPRTLVRGFFLIFLKNWRDPITSCHYKLGVEWGIKKRVANWQPFFYIGVQLAK